MRSTFVLALMGVLSLAALPAFAQIDTTLSWDGVNQISAWGAVGMNTPTYGQTITADVGFSKLLNFTFYIQGQTGVGLDNVNYSASVYAWDSTSGVLTGSALWNSGVLNTGLVSEVGFTPFYFAPNVDLTVGNTYMMLLTTTDVPDSGGSTGGAQLGYLGSDFFGADGYSGGGFYWSNDTALSDLFTNPWSSSENTFGGPPGVDLAFKVNAAPLSVTPEAPGLLQLLPGLLPVGYLLARRRRKAA